MVTFSDPKELRQALVEMDHHMVSSEMTAPEGGLASLVQHVLHVKLTEVGRLLAEGDLLVFTACLTCNKNLGWWIGTCTVYQKYSSDIYSHFNSQCTVCDSHAVSSFGRARSHYSVH